MRPCDPRRSRKQGLAFTEPSQPARRVAAMSGKYQLDEPVPRVADGHVNVDVRGGYSPEVIVARAGQPLRLTFTRHDTWPCGDGVVFPDFGVAAELPPHVPIDVELSLEKPGEYMFTCSRGLLSGWLLVETAAPETSPEEDTL